MRIDRGRLGTSMRLLLGCLLISLALVGASPALAADGTPTPGSAQGSPPAASTVPPGQAKPPDAVAGKATFSASDKCAACHGASGDGKGPTAANLSVPPTAFNDFTTVAGISLADMYNVTKNGRMERMMPPWSSSLTDQQIWDAVGYAWTLHTSQQEVDNGKQVFQTNCASCHGNDGKGKAGVPDLTNFPTTSTQTQNDWLQAVASGRGQMPAFGDKLKPEEQRAALEYARSLSFTRMFRGPITSGPGVITGTVINGTTAQSMPNLAVKLQILDGETVAADRQGTTDAQGSFRFSDLPVDPTLSYAVTTDYPDGVPYGSTPAAFPDKQTAMNVPLHVFEPSTDPSGISADRLHFIVDFDPTTSTLQVAELVMFSLNSDRAYVGDKDKIVLRFNLPAGAQDLNISDGELGQRYVKTDTGFADTQPLSPGQGTRQVLFRYSLPYSGDTFDLVRTVPYPVANANALVADMGEKVASPQLTSQPLQQTDMGNFINLTGQNLPANQAITLQFTNLSAVASASSAATGGATTPVASGTDRLLLVGLVAIVGIGAGLLASWPLLRSRRTRAAEAGETTGSEALIDALARLDLAHEAGEIGDAEYSERRLHLKAQLLDLIRQEGAQ